MAYEIKCGEDLGIANCDFAARGETPGDALAQMTDHLEDKHDLSLPDDDVILEGQDTNVVRSVMQTDQFTEEDRVVVERLREQLNVAEAQEDQS